MNTWLVCFDIEDDKTRRKIARLLEKKGIRVQKSVFECRFKTPDRKRRLLRQMRRILAHSPEKNPNIRFYKLNRDTLAESHDVEERPLPQPGGVIIL